ncbi:MAG: metallophosphoesterase [Cystobacterineae bacterium]|nr:metallophosphoesterase [Cystobacterineae bacterium]
MRLFAIADLHLPSARQKSMACFGWNNHPATLAQRWDESVSPKDCVVVAGDISWAMKPAEAVGDLGWLQARPGKKILLKGNHDYWWPDSASKLQKILQPFPSIVGFVHNCAVQWGPFVISGSRLWDVVEAPWEKFESTEAAKNAEAIEAIKAKAANNTADLAKMIQRETQRLQTSLDDAQTHIEANPQLIHIVASHFPPLYADGAPTPFSTLIESRNPKHCIYGHLHGPSLSSGFVGMHGGVNYVLASCDAVEFRPRLVELAPSAFSAS